MIVCKALDKGFQTKEQMFTELRNEKHVLIARKKASQKTFVEGLPNFLGKSGTTTKAEDVSQLEIGGTVKNAINTIYWFDSHEDVHLPSNWNKTVKEQSGKVYHVINHEIKIGTIVGYPEDVKVSVQNVAWKDLGVDFEGETEVLVGETKITERTNKDAFLAYRDKMPVQHSPRLIYVDFALAMDSNDPADKEEKALFDKIIPFIPNKEKVIENGYFFAIKEARLYNEFSTVIFGSNSATINLDKNIEPSEDTQHKEAAQALQPNYKYLIENLNTKN